jgi:fatty acid desaturase
MIPFIFGIYKYLSLGKAVLSPDKQRKKLTIWFLVTILLISSLLIYFGHLNVILAWLISLFLVTEPVHFLIELPEHYGCKKISTEKYENTRTIKNASSIAKWFTNWNNFHVEHHLNPWVLPENLANFHKTEISKK